MSSDRRPPIPAEWAEVCRLLEGAIDLPREQWEAYLEANRAPARVRRQALDLLAQRSDSRVPRDADAMPDPPAASSLPAGTRVGHYAVVRRLGAGGMGTVYLARDERLGREVALKVLRRQPDQRARNRLLREARAVAALDHPSICAVHEVGSDPAVGDFIVMQFIDGGTLADRLTRGPMRPTEAVMVCRQLAEALAEAHAHGIVHRDLKPQNVAIHAGGRPRLLDFGIARTMQPASDTGMATTQVTEAGGVVGTPSYMAPEQIRGEHVDGRSDLFSLGCVLYECLTGQRAFDGSTAQEICGQVLHVTPPVPSALRPELHHDHDTLCLRLLEKEPAHRFQSADEAIGALRLVETGTTTPVVRPVRRWWHGRRWSLGVAAGLALTAVLAVTQALWPKRLPEAPPDARHWYEQGVDALRSDSFAVALSRLQEAVRLFPDYVEAHARMAEAHAELDDQEAAYQALVLVNKLVPDESDLAADERLRLRGVRASVLRDHDEALAVYSQLTQRQPGDVGLVVDLAGAQEAAGRLVEASATLARAVAEHPQAAAARLRLGAVQARLGERDVALQSLGEAARLYSVSANREGEADAWLHVAAIANDGTDLAVAKEALQKAEALLGDDDRYRVLRLRARFQTALLLSSSGDFSAAQQLAAHAVDDAVENGLQSVAANGLTSMADALLVAGKIDQADAALKRAVLLADQRKATKTAMRARLQRAVILAATGNPADAQELASSASEYFERHGFVRLAAQAQNVQASVHADLEQFALAASLSEATLAYAERVDDRSLAAESLETLAHVQASLGNLPAALGHQARLSDIYRDRGNLYALPYSLANQASLLIRLGRGHQADTLLGEVDRRADGADASYARHTQKAAVLRALHAAIDGRHSDVISHITRARALGLPGEGETPILASALNEYAHAGLGMPFHVGVRPPAADVCQFGEACYWKARAAVLRGDNAACLRIVELALGATVTEANHEVEWRLRALRVLSGDRDSKQAALAGDARAHLSSWGASLASYELRRDLQPLIVLLEKASQPGGDS